MSEKDQRVTLTPVQRIESSLANIEQAALGIDNGEKLAMFLEKIQLAKIALAVLKEVNKAIEELKNQEEEDKKG